jgi:hypothetical protein
MNKSDVDTEIGTLTVVDACGARRNQARNPLRDGVIFDSSVLLQFESTLYKGIAEQRRQSCEVHDDIHFCFAHRPAL